MQHLTDDQLLDLLDGFTSAEQNTMYTAHVSGCDNCKARYQTFVAIHARLAEMPLQKPSIVFTERVLEQWDSVRLAVTVKKKRTQLTPFVFLTFMGALVLGCLAILHLISNPGSVVVPVGDAVNAVGNIAGNQSFWKLLILSNALLLLWLFNQRILQPFFNHRMAV